MAEVHHCETSILEENQQEIKDHEAHRVWHSQVTIFFEKQQLLRCSVVEEQHSEQPGDRLHTTYYFCFRHLVKTNTLISFWMFQLTAYA